MLGSKIGVESTEQSLSLPDAQGNLRMDSSWLHSGTIEDARRRDVTEHQPDSVLEHTRFMPEGGHLHTLAIHSGNLKNHLFHLSLLHLLNRILTLLMLDLEMISTSKQVNTCFTF